MIELYKHHKIDMNDHNRKQFDAIDMKDCDAFILSDNTIEGLKEQIDEKVDFDELYKETV
jgi:protein-tyrosine-phosphatase